MRIDWIIAVFTFLVIISWSFAYYTLLSSGAVRTAADAAMRDGGKVADYFKAAYTEMPVNFTVPADANSIVLWTYMNWTWEPNTTRVSASRMSPSTLPCEVTSDRVYWQADVSAGENQFFISGADMDAPLQCTQTLTKTDDNQTTEWAGFSSPVLSNHRTLEICAMVNNSYHSAKSGMGVSMDFNVVVENATGAVSCGQSPPSSGTVYVFPYSCRLWDGGTANITVMLWQ